MCLFAVEKNNTQLSECRENLNKLLQVLSEEMRIDQGNKKALIDRVNFYLSKDKYLTDFNLGLKKLKSEDSLGNKLVTILSRDIYGINDGRVFPLKTKNQNIHANLRTLPLILMSAFAILAITCIITAEVVGVSQASSLATRIAMDGMMISLSSILVLFLTEAICNGYLESKYRIKKSDIGKQSSGPLYLGDADLRTITAKFDGIQNKESTLVN